MPEGLLDLKEILAHKDHLDLLGNKDLLVLKEILDHQVQLVQQGQKALQDHQDLKAPKEISDSQGQRDREETSVLNNFFVEKWLCRKLCVH